VLTKGAAFPSFALGGGAGRCSFPAAAERSTRTKTQDWRQREGRRRWQRQAAKALRALVPTTRTPQLKP